MENKRKIAVIGGDRRQNAAADYLCEHDYTVYTWGLSGSTKYARATGDIRDALAGAEAVVLPVPLSRDGRYVSGTNCLLEKLSVLLRPEMQIFAGKISPEIKQILTANGCRVVDICQDEGFMIKNAVPTAEGAIEIAIANTPRTIYNSQILILGYGRIAKVLAALLAAMGAHITVAARKEADLTWAVISGYQVLPIRCQKEKSILRFPRQSFHVIFNTVPYLLVTEDMLKKISYETLLIELASAPGGFDTDAAKRLGFTLIPALSLPGKTAPITAGEIVGEVIHDHLRKGVTL